MEEIPDGHSLPTIDGLLFIFSLFFEAIPEPGGPHRIIDVSIFPHAIEGKIAEGPERAGRKLWLNTVQCGHNPHSADGFYLSLGRQRPRERMAAAPLPEEYDLTYNEICSINVIFGSH